MSHDEHIPEPRTAAAGGKIAPPIEEGLRAFRRDLGTLLREAPGQWVAYRGGDRLGIAATKSEAYQLGFRCGWKRGDFLVRSIEPALEEVVVGPGFPPPPAVGDRGE